MHIYMKKYLLSLAIFVSACQSSPQNAGKQVYWDFPSFFLQQADALQVEKPRWEKSVWVEQQREVKEVKNVDWEKELALFLEIDLNKTAYLGQVSVNTTDSLTHYQVTEPELPIREVKIRWATPQQTPARIDMHWHSENKLYQTDKKLIAFFKEGKLDSYQIQTFQKITGLSPDKVRLEAKRKGS